jgi:CRP-like cAMP-binding protein
MLVFVTTLEALEFCETTLLQRAHRTTVLSPLQRRIQQGQTLTVASIFQLLLDATEEEEELLKLLESGRYHDEISFQAGDVVFAKDTHADAFYVVLQGSVAIVSTSSTHRRKSFRQPFPGMNAGALITPTSPTTTTTTPRLDPKLAAHATSVWPTGGVFGFVDFWLQRPRVFQVVCCTQSPTICAKMTHSHWNLLQQENEALAALVQRVLLNASVADLANCTCSET